MKVSASWTFCPGKFGSYNNFVRRFCNAQQNQPKQHRIVMDCAMNMELLQTMWKRRGEHCFNTSGASNLNELHHRLKQHVMIRRLKKEDFWTASPVDYTAAWLIAPADANAQSINALTTQPTQTTHNTHFVQASLVILIHLSNATVMRITFTTG